jgi:hypothetical protein
LLPVVAVVVAVAELGSVVPAVSAAIAPRVLSYAVVLMTSDLGTSRVLGSQVTVAAAVAAQAASGSPSETVTVSVTDPGTVQVKLGFAELALLNEPEGAVHLYVSGAGPPSGSWAVTRTAMGKPTATSAGLSEMPSATGHRLSVPLMATLPVVLGCWQVRCRLTAVTAPAVTANVASPAQVVAPSVVAASTGML